MSSTEALIYCLGVVNDYAIDGEQYSRTVYDRNGSPHWIAWPINVWNGPRLCSESPRPFAESLEPYRTSKE